MKTNLYLMMLFFSVVLYAQDGLPYKEIPKLKEQYTPQNVVVRLVDGLGFRYYWATKGLRAEDLAYQPKGDGRNCQKTINHLYDLSKMMLRLTKTTLEQQKTKDAMTFAEMRAQTLFNLQAVSNKIKRTKQLSELSVKEGKTVTIPFFNVINGPIADAIWHTGQVASFRRSSGNPINSKVNHFSGTVRE